MPKQELQIERAATDIMVDILKMSRPDPDGWSPWFQQANTYDDLFEMLPAGGDLETADTDLIHLLVLAIARSPAGRTALRKWMAEQKAARRQWIDTRDNAPAEVA